jgi:hypothetical protein
MYNVNVHSYRKAGNNKHSQNPRWFDAWSVLVAESETSPYIQAIVGTRFCKCRGLPYHRLTADGVDLT